MPPTSLPVPHHLQSKPGACLLACIRMVLEYLGQEVSETQLASFLKTSDFGTPSFYVNRLTEWGYRVIYESGSSDRLRLYLNAGSPCIVFIQTGWLSAWDENLAHALVVVGAEGELFYALDPAIENTPVIIDAQELELAWSEFDYRYAVIQR